MSIQTFYVIVTYKIRKGGDYYGKDYYEEFTKVMDSDRQWLTIESNDVERLFLKNFQFVQICNRDLLDLYGNVLPRESMKRRDYDVYDSYVINYNVCNRCGYRNGSNC